MVIPNRFAVQIFAVARQAERTIAHAVGDVYLDKPETRQEFRHFCVPRLRYLEWTIQHVEALLDGQVAELEREKLPWNFFQDVMWRRFSAATGATILHRKQLQFVRGTLVDAERLIRGACFRLNAVPEPEWPQWWQTRKNLGSVEAIIERRCGCRSELRTYSQVENFFQPLFLTHVAIEPLFHD